jgi:hypothetical protein
MDPNPLARGTDPRILNRTEMSRIANTASKTESSFIQNLKRCSIHKTLVIICALGAFR